jgi:2-amino-4-hydroxy-6-hydroxymethyldihydropteridine pyrophosphokinase
MAVAYLSIGTNIGNKRKNLITASALLAERAGDILALSAFYETEPWGFDSKNEFLNAVLLLETQNSPEKLLALSSLIELEMGRTVKSSGQYHDRIIDIDILLYDDLIMETSSLTLPHPRMHQRLFVLEPMIEIAPNVIHPTLKKSILELYQSCLSDKGD